MAIEPINNRLPIMPVAAQPPVQLDKGKQLNSNTVSAEKLVVGMQNINKDTHKILEGTQEKKLYI